MKFWFTVVIGVIAVAAISTALMVLSPSAQPVAAPKTEPVKIDPNTTAIAEIVGPQEFTHENLGQNQKGQDVFRIRNAGKAPLIVTPMQPTCQCTDMYLADKEPSPSEPAPKSAEQKSDYTVEPGKEVVVVARWDTKGKLAKQNVGVPVRLTNDPRKMEIQFRINLDIHKEIVQSSDKIEFGMLDEGQKKTASATITSPVRDKFEIAKLETGPKWFTVKAAPLSAAELKAAGAKSGYRIEVANDGKNPVGLIDEVVAAQIKSPDSSETIQFHVTGRVLGDVETDPPGDVLDFKEVMNQNNRPKIVRIFTRTLKDSEALSIGTVKPEGTLTAKIEKNPKYKGWTLTVAISPKAPGGPISGGSVAIKDSSGRERLVFRVTGVIDPAFSRTAQR